MIQNDKKTPTEYPIVDILKHRWSPRVFAKTPIKEVQIKSLLEAGRWAASSNNLQPWRVIWGLKGTDTYDRIYNCLVDFNQEWTTDAQALWVCAFKKTMKDGEEENFHALHDLGLFMGNVCVQAQSMGIAVHQMAGLDHKKAKQEFKFPNEYHVATAAAFGFYGGDAEKLPEDLEKQEKKVLRERKSQNLFAFNGNYKDSE